MTLKGILFLFLFRFGSYKLWDMWTLSTGGRSAVRCMLDCSFDAWYMQYGGMASYSDCLCSVLCLLQSQLVVKLEKNAVQHWQVG